MRGLINETARTKYFVVRFFILSNPSFCFYIFIQ